ncbi:MAG: bifunctional DNA-formamidopyrimidine glycosylase/DNA-(apurinic or apyrimidinic site) lyase [Armatimonadota bacterium]
MPELPEVETIRRQIAPVITDQQILFARATCPRAIRAHCNAEEFISQVVHRRILGVTRRGKALLILLDNDTSILVRLGMSGRVNIAEPDDAVAPHTHVVLGLSNGKELRYIDPRTFGQMAVLVGHDPDRMIELGHYGPEPLSDGFTPEVLAGILSGKRTVIQAVLMDQSKIAGIGKIYADEACFLAGIYPRRTADSLTKDEVLRLHTAIREVLARSIDARGTSSQDAAYRDASGSTGNFQNQLHVYQRENQPCRVCGTLIEYRPFQGRRIHFCPKCQK